MGADQGPLARAPWACERDGQGQPAVRGGGALPLPRRRPLARSAGALRRVEEGPHPLWPLGQAWGMGTSVRALGGRSGQRVRDDRQHDRPRASAQRRCGQKDGDEAIGRSRGGLSTKIHARVDALVNPTWFVLSPGQAHDLAHDLEGADALLPGLAADALIADKVFDAEERVLRPLEKAGKAAVIPPKANRKEPRPYDKDLILLLH